MKETREIANNLLDDWDRYARITAGFGGQVTNDDARMFVRRRMRDETPQVIDAVAQSLMSMYYDG